MTIRTRQTSTISFVQKILSPVNFVVMIEGIEREIFTIWGGYHKQNVFAVISRHVYFETTGAVDSFRTVVRKPKTFRSPALTRSKEPVSDNDPAICMHSVVEDEQSQDLIPLTDDMERTRSTSTERSVSSANSVMPSDPQMQTDTSDTSSLDEVPVADCQATKWNQTRTKLEELWNEFLLGLSETNEQLAERQPKELGKLSPNALRRDIFRCLSESQGYLETVAGIREFLIWKQPLASLCLFCSLHVFCLHRIPNSLLSNFDSPSTRNIKIGLHFTPRKEVATPKFDLSGAQLVFDVARRAQQMLTIIADILEKLKSLFNWENPKVTLHFVSIISFFLCLSLLTSLNTFLIVIGFLIGGKAFLMTFTYYRWPRLRYMFDIAFYFYRNLPTKKTAAKMNSSDGLSSRLSSHLPKSRNRCDSTSLPHCNSDPVCPSTAMPSVALRRQSVGVVSLSEVDAGSVSTESSKETADSESGTVDERESIFKITRSCALVDKASTFSRVTKGTAILNEEMLVFRYRNTKSAMIEIIEMPFSSIVSLRKFKTIRPLGRLKPTRSKGIELELSGRNKPLQLVGLAKRNDFYESLVQNARMSGVELEEDAVAIDGAQ
ncbi:GRAM domain-containing protein 4 [Aphelenchoides besseyi]|nr:GRAM domain-containing protein 4 [Aphelenchoides besseyi]